MATNRMANRKFLIIGNWKMEENEKYMDSLIRFVNQAPLDSNAEVVLAAPENYLDYIQSKLTKRNMTMALTDCPAMPPGRDSPEPYGVDRKETGRWVILGQAERRRELRESDQLIGDKIKYALKNGYKVVACVGDSLEEKEFSRTQAVLSRQMAYIANSVKGQWSRVALAYQPVWATGTCKMILPEEVEDMHTVLRAWMDTNVSPVDACQTRIIYGGPVNGNSCRYFAGQPDVDGFLINTMACQTDFLKSVNARK